MKFPNFDYRAPTSLEEAVALLAANDEARPLAGGQSLLPIMAFRLAHPRLLVDLARIPGLDRIEADETTLRLGARVTWRMLQDDPRVARACPLLAAALEHVAHYQIRNRGTIGGSLAHADPAAELPTVALVCGAQLQVVGSAGARQASSEDLFVGPLMTSLKHDELITHVEFPVWPQRRRWAFEEFSRRRGDFALAGVAVFYDRDESDKAAGVRIGAIGAADTPIRLRRAEAALEGQLVDDAAIAFAAQEASAEVEPAGDMHGSAAYRKALVGTMLRRALERAKSRAGVGA